MKFEPYEEYKEVDLPWLDRVPSHWDMERGKQVFISKKEINSKYQCSNILSLTLNGVVNNDVNNPIGLVPKDYATYQIFEKGNLVFKLIDLQNYNTSRVGLVHEKGIMSSAYIRLERFAEGNTKYFYYQYYDLYLRGVYNKLGGGVRSTLNAKDLLNFNIEIPPKEEQDKIVEFLDVKLEKIDRFIELREKQIELFQEEKEVLINDAVTRGIDRSVKYKDSGIDWIGEIPEHWEMERVKNITELASRGVTPIYTEKIMNKVVNQATFSKGYWDNSNIRYTEVSPINCRGTLKPNDILLASTGGGVLGKVYHFMEKDTYIADSHVTILRCNKKIDSKYMYYHFLIKYDLINARLAQGATNQTEIQGGWLKSFKLPLPPLSEQKQIVAHIEKETSKIDKTIGLYKKQINLIKEYRTSLISQAVTGKIDVRSFQGVG